MDYFVDLGVETLWLSPIYESPMKDFGYDISDFRNIDPLFGDLDDFDELVEEMHNRGDLIGFLKYTEISCMCAL